ncbi:MAG: flagellar hook protein FlgE [Phycisphaerales bacterium JB039]
MASTTALYSGLSGLNVSARRLDVIGNNIANVNTTAFKGSRLLQTPQVSRTFRVGTEPGQSTGGSNPGQIGLGVSVAGVQRDVGAGALAQTGNPRDLAIEGAGWFIVRRGEDQMYTRAGAFGVSEAGELVTPTGERVLGYGVDSGFNVVQGQLNPIRIPIGTLGFAEATSRAEIRGNLDASGDVATVGSITRLLAAADTGFSLITGAANPPDDPASAIEPASLLTELADPAAGPDTPLFADGQSLELRGVEKGEFGGRTLPADRLDITAATTVQSLMDFLARALGIRTDTPASADSAPGVRLDTATGEIFIEGNAGRDNNIVLHSDDLFLLDAAGEDIGRPLVTQQDRQADGESQRTTMVAFDSLGASAEVNITMVLESRVADQGTTWRYYVEGTEPTASGIAAATGEVNFNSSGALITEASVPVPIARPDTGAFDPIVFNLIFDRDAGNLTAATQPDSAIGVEANGAPFGTLSAFGVQADGVITGVFDNGRNRPIGQVALATFMNAEGLIADASNLFRSGPNSGDVVVTTPGAFGAGAVRAGALEMSNVDLGQEFIEMILTSTGYSAAGRVVRTTDELMQQLLVLGR